MEFEVKYISDHVTDYPYYAGRVKRYHTWLVHHQQTVGEHCWQVALIYEQIFGVLTSDTERFIRHHDTAELVVGDPPFPVKARNPALKAEFDRLEDEAMEQLGVLPLPVLSPEERTRVKVCDLLEMTLLGMTEHLMGNLLAVPVVERTAYAAEQLAKKLPAEEARSVERWLSGQRSRYEMILGRRGSLTFVQ